MKHSTHLAGDLQALESNCFLWQDAANGPSWADIVNSSNSGYGVIGFQARFVPSPVPLRTKWMPCLTCAGYRADRRAEPRATWAVSFGRKKFIKIFFFLIVDEIKLKL
jgi:hypothetical protein